VRVGGELSGVRVGGVPLLEKQFVVTFLTRALRFRDPFLLTATILREWEGEPSLKGL
jgi:hypothetical protein